MKLNNQDWKMLVVGIISIVYGIQSLYTRNTIDYITIIYLALAVGYFMHGDQGE